MNTDTYTTKAIVVSETSDAITFLLEDGPTILYRPSVKRNEKKTAVIESRRIRIQRKHILAGSDNFGMPSMQVNEDGSLAEDTVDSGGKVQQGTLVIPQWIATQNGVWKRNDPIIQTAPQLPIVAQNNRPSSIGE